jgi:hypothetical protein
LPVSDVEKQEIANWKLRKQLLFFAAIFDVPHGGAASWVAGVAVFRGQQFSF